MSYVDSDDGNLLGDESLGDKSVGDRPTFLLTVRSPEERIASAWLESPIEPPGFETQNSRKRFYLDVCGRTRTYTRTDSDCRL